MPTFSVKAFDEEGSGGIRQIWENVVGYTKKEILIEDGFLYTFVKNRNCLVRQGAYDLSKLLKICIDLEEKKMRLVFRDESKRVQKNYQLESIS